MGKIVLTGANGGIGSATATELMNRGHEVIAINRSDADLSLMGEVNRLADELISRHGSLDGLLLNAGLATTGLILTPEGFETTFAVNHLGSFLLAHRLLPLLQESPHGRIVLTGSTDHMSVKAANVSALAQGEDHGYTKTYARSKTVAMAAMLEMAHRLQPAIADDEDALPDYVRVNVADPGWTRTGLTRDAPRAIRLLVTFGRPLQNRPKHSARVLADLATTTEETGRYIGIKGPLTPSVLLRDEGFRRNAYDQTTRLLVDHGFANADDFLPAR